MQVPRNIPQRFRPKPYLWHAAGVSTLLGAQLASDNNAFPRLYEVGPIKPFDHFGNMPTSAIIAMGSTYGALALSQRLGYRGYNKTKSGRNIPKSTTKAACTLVGAGVGLFANAIVETKFGLTQLERVTDLYKNDMGVNGGQHMDLAAGVLASAIAGRISASTFPSITSPSRAR